MDFFAEQGVVAYCTVSGSSQLALQLPVIGWLGKMEVPVADEHIAVSALCGLSERFEHLIVAADVVTSKNTLSLDFVKSCMLQE